MWLVILGCSRGVFAKFRSLRVNWLVYLKVASEWLILIGWLTIGGLLANRKIFSICFVKG